MSSTERNTSESPHRPNGPYYPVGLLGGEYCKHDRLPWPCPDADAGEAS